MEDTSHAIRQGRILADEGLYEHAVETWKTALSGAYALQDYAGMFVLSGNVGEACVRVAMQSKESSRALKLLQEAVENLDYALQIVEKCSLREVLGGYRVLYQGVRRAETLRKKAQKLMDKLQWVDKEVDVKVKEEVLTCTTCGEIGEDIVLDENDGCNYCKRCYDEYYAAETVAGTPEDLANVEEEKVDAGGLNTNDRAKDDQWAARPDEQDDGGVEVVVPESDPTSDLVEAGEVVPVSKDKQIDQVVQENTEEITLTGAHKNITEKVMQDRVRYERVELGSLADFLAGKLHLENEAQQLETQQNDGSSDAGMSLTKVSTDTGGKEGFSEGSVADTAATLDEDVEEALVLIEAEDTADAIPDKLEYSIAQLLELRKSSPSDCPETLLGSPVRDDGTAPTPARNKPNNSRKKSNAKKTSRSVTSHRQNNADSADSNQIAASEKPTISPLPTLGLCAAMRKALQEHQERQADSSPSCDNLAPTASLLDSPGTACALGLADVAVFGSISSIRIP